MNYEYQDENAINGKYSFCAQLIDINFDSEETTNSYLVTLHEYTHYLQSMTTVFGISSFCEFFWNHLDVLANIVSKKIEPPYNKSQDQDFIKLMELYDSNIRKYTCKSSISSNSILFPERISFDIMPLASDLKFIGDNLYFADTIKQHWVLITHSVIRENMCKMSEFMLKIKNNSFDKMSSLEKLSSEYYIIYLFLSTINKTQTEALTYLVCEMSLMSVNPVDRFYEFIVILLNTDPNLHVKEISRKLMNKKISEEDNVLIQKTEELVADLSQIGKKYSTNIKYLEIISSYCEIFLNALEYRKIKVTLLSKIMDANWFNDVAEKFGSPLVMYRGKDPFFFGTPDGKKSFLRVIFYSIFILFDYFRENKRLDGCPFYNTIPICELKFDDKICLDNPHSVHKHEQFHGCILQNDLMMFGIFT